MKQVYETLYSRRLVLFPRYMYKVRVMLNEASVQNTLQSKTGFVSKVHV